MRVGLFLWSAVTLLQAATVCGFVVMNQATLEQAAQKGVELARQASCLPRVCTKPFNVFQRGNQAKIYVASFPGSGSTLLRNVIQHGSRRLTGSMYVDRALQEEGMETSHLRAKDPRLGIIKTHFPYYKFGTIVPHPWATAAIHIVRSPFAAVLAECQRVSLGSHVRSVQNVTQLFHACEETVAAVSTLDKWGEFVRFWSSEQLVSSATKPQVSEMPGHPGFYVLTLFYEDLVQNFEQTASILFAYLRILLGDQVPTVETSLLCAANSMDALDILKRRDSSSLVGAFQRDPNLTHDVSF